MLGFVFIDFSNNVKVDANFDGVRHVAGEVGLKAGDPLAPRQNQPARVTHIHGSATIR